MVSNMNNSEKLCMKWNDFQENVNCAFRELRDDTDFADVTLAGEDGKPVEAHKVVLASSSQFFKEILKRSNHPHPLVFLRGVRSKELSAIIDFLYFGEANVEQAHIDTFLALAEDLKLKGLANENNVILDIPPTKSRVAKKEAKSAFENEPRHDNEITDKSQDNKITDNTPTPEMSFPVTNYNVDELEEQVKSMIEHSENTIQIGNTSRKASKCKVCGKEGYIRDIMRHVESNHVAGLTHTCNVCGKNSSSKDGLRQHRNKRKHFM